MAQLFQFFNSNKLDRMSKMKLPFAPIKVPIIDWLPEYTKVLFLSDLSAGLTVFVLLVPQSMAYALLAGLPPVYGLYSSTIPLFIYALLGTSREISMGPMAITSLLLGVSCQKYGFEEASAEYIQVAMNVSMLVGFILFAVGACRMGTLINLLSHSVLVGFISASALVILINQLKYVLGLHVPRFKYIHQTVWYLLTHLQEANGYAAALGLGTWFNLYVVREMKRRAKAAPARLSSLTLTIISSLGNVSNFLAILIGMAVAKLIISGGGTIGIVGDVPSGMKAPGFSFVDFPTFLGIIPDSLALAFVSFAGNWAVAKKFAIQGKYQIDATQELIAEGLTNIMGVVFNSFVVSGGLARSAVNAESGAKTQIAGCVTATCILISILAFTSFLYYIPMASLGAVINVSVVPLVNVQEMLATYRVDKKDCLVMVVTFLSTLFIGVSEGLFVGIFVSVVIVMRSTAFPYIAHLGRVRYTERLQEEQSGNPMHASETHKPFSSKESTVIVDTSRPERNYAGSLCSVDLGSEADNSADEATDLLPGQPSEDSRFYYQDVKRFPDAVQLPGIAIVRMDASLYYANCDFFRDTVKRAAAGEFHTSRQPIKHVIVDASGWGDIDLAGITTLFELKKELCASPVSNPLLAMSTTATGIGTEEIDQIDIEPDVEAAEGAAEGGLESSRESVVPTGVLFSMVNVKGNIRDRFRQSKLLDEFGDSRLNMTIDDAIRLRSERGDSRESAGRRESGSGGDGGGIGGGGRLGTGERASVGDIEMMEV